MATFAITTTNEALAVNNYVSRQVIDLLTLNSALLYGVMGKPSNMSKVFQAGSGGTAGKVLTHYGMRAVQGLEQEHHYFVEFDTWTATAPGSGAYAPVSLAYNADAVQGAKYTLTQFDHHFGIEYERIRKIRGEAAKGAAKEIRAVEFSRQSKGFMKQLSEWINTNQNQTAAAVGGWPFAVDSTGTYMGVDRSLAGNSKFRGGEASIGTLADTDIATAINTVSKEGAMVKDLLGIADATEMVLIQQLAWDLPGAVMQNDGWIKFPGPLVRMLGVPFALDGDAPADTIGLLDLSTFDLQMQESGVEIDDLGPSQVEVGVHRFAIRTAVGFTCRDPRRNYKMTDV